MRSISRYFHSVRYILFFIFLISHGAKIPLFAQESGYSKKQIFLLSDSLFKAGNLYFQYGVIDSAICLWTKALEGFEFLGEKKAIAALLNNLALAYKRLRQDDRYLQILEKQLMLSRKNPDLKTFSSVTAALSQYWADHFQPERADSLIATAVDVIRGTAQNKDIANVLLQAGYLKLRQSKILPAYELFQEAAELYQQSGDSLEWSQALLGSGLSLLEIGKYKEAEMNFEQAAKVKMRFHDQRGLAKVLTHLGVVYDYLGLTEKAEDYYRKAYDLCDSLQLHEGKLDNLMNLGIIYHQQGNYQKAIENYQQARLMARPEQYKTLYGQLLTNIALLYRDLNDLDSALFYLNQAIQIERTTKDWLGLAGDLSILGNIYWRRSDYIRAQQAVEEAINIRKMIGEKRGLSNDLIYLGIILNSLLESEIVEHTTKQKITADTILTIFRQALAIKEEINDFSGIITAHTYLGQAYRLSEKFAEAVIHLKRADSLARQRLAYTLQWQIKHALAKTYEMQKLYSEAIFEYRQALEIVENQRALLKTEDFRMGFFKDKSYLYADAIQLFFNLKQFAEAFEIAERARSRTFLDLLGSRLAASLSISADKAALDSIEEQIRLSGLNEPLQSSSQHFQQLMEQKNSLLRKLTQNRDEQTELMAVIPYPADSICLYLPENLTLIEYYLTQKVLYSFIVTQHGVVGFKTDISYPQLFSHIQNYLQALKNPRNNKYKALSKKLHTILIKPIVRHLRTERLCIVPHEILHYIPFATLMNEQEQPLIDSFTISTLPTANLLRFIVQKRKPATRDIQGLALFAMGNPKVPRFTPLQAAEQEVRFIGELFNQKNIFLNEQANKDQFFKHAKESEIIHLACHGIYNFNEPLQSALLLTPEGNHDGKLTVRELYHYSFSKAQLIVLSACETGLAKYIRGDELIGFNRACLYAGAPSVITSLWQVSDVSTGKLMMRFYKNLNSTDKPGSLRQAQLYLKSLKGYEHPFFWGAFQITGDYQ